MSVPLTVALVRALPCATIRVCGVVRTDVRMVAELLLDLGLEAVHPDGSSFFDVGDLTWWLGFDYNRFGKARVGIYARWHSTGLS